MPPAWKNCISMVSKHIIIGQKGEQIACEIMEAKGFKIIQRNWKMGHLEMDIIAGNKTDIIFVEVKTRTSTFGGQPEEAVDLLKRKRMVAAANAYIKYYQEERRPRFDIIGILLNNAGEIEKITHLENAFIPPLKTRHANSFSGLWKWHHRRKIIK